MATKFAGDFTLTETTHNGRPVSWRSAPLTWHDSNRLVVEGGDFASGPETVEIRAAVLDGHRGVVELSWPRALPGPAIHAVIFPTAEDALTARAWHRESREADEERRRRLDEIDRGRR